MEPSAKIERVKRISAKSFAQALNPRQPLSTVPAETWDAIASALADKNDRATKAAEAQKDKGKNVGKTDTTPPAPAHE